MLSGGSYDVCLMPNVDTGGFEAEASTFFLKRGNTLFGLSVMCCSRAVRATSEIQLRCGNLQEKTK